MCICNTIKLAQWAVQKYQPKIDVDDDDDDDEPNIYMLGA